MTALTITQQQADDIVAQYVSGSFSYQAEIEKLLAAGYSQLEAEQQVTEVVSQLRKQLYDAKKKAGKKAEGKNIAFYVVLITAAIGPIFEITSSTWTAVALVISVLAAYFGYKEKPIGAIASAIVMVFLFPVTYHFYFKNRTSYIRLELLIPLVLTFIPAGIVFLLFNAIFHPTKNE